MTQNADGNHMDKLAGNIADLVVRKLNYAGQNSVGGTGPAACGLDGNGQTSDLVFVLSAFSPEMDPAYYAISAAAKAVGLRAACPDNRVKALIGLGVPAAPIDDRTYDFTFLRTCDKPKLFVSGGRDQFATAVQLHTLVGSVPEPKKLVLIEGADHFFEGRLREMREIIEQWVGNAVIL